MAVIALPKPLTAEECLAVKNQGQAAWSALFPDEAAWLEGQEYPYIVGTQYSRGQHLGIVRFYDEESAAAFRQTFGGA